MTHLLELRQDPWKFVDSGRPVLGGPTHCFSEGGPLPRPFFQYVCVNDTRYDNVQTVKDKKRPVEALFLQVQYQY